MGNQAALSIFIGVLMPENSKEKLGVLFGFSADQSSIEFNKLTFNQTFNLNLKPKWDVFKQGHFVMFTILTITIMRTKTFRKEVTKVVIFLILFALVTEVLQLFIAGRTSQLSDVLIDNAGILSGSIIISIIQLVIYSSSSSTKNLNN